MKHFRKIMAFVTALALLISILPAGALATVGSTTTSGYTVVTTWEELYNGVPNGGDFLLANDISAPVQMAFIGGGDSVIIDSAQGQLTDDGSVQFNLSDLEPVVIDNPELVIPGGVTVTIDLNGHKLSCGGIQAGEEKAASLGILSSGTIGILEISGAILVSGDFSLENCKVSAAFLDGGNGSITLKGASVDFGVGAEEEIGIWWGGSSIKLSGNSKIALNGCFFQLEEATKIEIEAGSEITGITFIEAYSWETEALADLPNFIKTIETYAAAAGFTLSVDKEGECIIFLDESGKQVESGSLKGVTKMESADVEISFNDKVYNGRVKDIEVKVDGKALDGGVDYDASFRNAAGNMVSECKDAGKYTVTVTGKGDYAGTATGQIEIAKADALYEPPKKPIDGTQPLSKQYEDLGFPCCNISSLEIISNSTSLSTSVGNTSQITLAGSWKFETATNMTMDSGKYDAGAVFTPDNKNYNEVKTTVEISTWGAEVNVGTETSPAWNYEARSGVTSASITDGITWIKEESGGVTTWYGIDNSKNVFAKGSKFSVQKLSEKENDDEWNKYLAKLDEAQKKLIENNKLDIFLVSVDGPDGKAYTSLSGPTEFYIQLGDGWDKEKLQALFISDSVDETYTIEIVEMVLPDGTKAKMAKMTLNHFSPYALMAISLPDPSPETGDTSRILLWIMLAVLSCGAMTFAAVYNRKRRKA